MQRLSPAIPQPTPARVTAVAAALTSLVLAACVTINVYFPEERVREISEQIEQAVEERAGQDDAAVEPADLEPAEPVTGTARLSPAGWLLHLLPAGAAHAADVVAAPEITNPAIRSIIDSRARRLAEVERFKESGAIGESNQALLVVRDLEGLDLPQRAEVQRLIKAENADRERMFEEIAAATGVDRSQLPRIRETYAETLRQNADPGEWIQLPDGAWKRK